MTSIFLYSLNEKMYSLHLARWRTWNPFFTNCWLGWVVECNFEWNYCLQCKPLQL